MAIILMGVSGSGKSTLGALLARAFGCAFLEGDDFHAKAAVEKMRSGQPLTDEDRWPWLDRLGSALAARVAEDGCAVAACSALKQTYRARLMAATGGTARFILLDNDRDVLLRRLADRPGHYMPASLLDSQLDTLERPRPEEHVLILDSRDPPEALCAAAVAWLSDDRA